MLIKNTNVSRRTLYLIVLLFSFIAFSSCQKKPENRPPVEKTLFMYYPWSTNLLEYFEVNIVDMEKSLLQNPDDNYRVVVYLATSATESELFELQLGKKNSIKRESLKKYSGFSTIKPDGLAELLKDVKHYAPAHTYSMAISGHGLGWLPVQRSGDKVSPLMRMRKKENSNYMMTRYFGGWSTDAQMNIEDLAKALELSETHMDCIMFDACYMANVEVAYALREVCDYYVASPSEIMAYGMPYEKIGKPLLEGNYDKVCEEFLAFYSAFAIPCGTISAVDCSHLDELADAMKALNTKHSFEGKSLDDIQFMDAFRPSIFFDYESYIDVLCGETEEYKTVLSILEKVVISKKATSDFYTDTEGTFPINTYSGVTISDPSVHPTAKGKIKTEWYIDTHAKLEE